MSFYYKAKSYLCLSDLQNDDTYIYSQLKEKKTGKADHFVEVFFFFFDEIIILYLIRILNGS